MPDATSDLHIDLVLTDLQSAGIRQVLQALVLASAAHINCGAESLLARLEEKEKAGSSAIGGGLAVPHLKSSELERPFTALALLKKQIDWNTPDHKPVDLVCLVLSPEKDGPLHLRRLARISRFLKNHDLKNRLREVNDPQAVLSLLAANKDWMLAA